jgi:hypothetical protein
MQMIVVLPDGETWSTLEGCKILVISNGEYEDICEDRVSIREVVVPTIEVDLNKLISSIHPEVHRSVKQPIE